MNDIGLPVRERNRLRTWSLIHEAAATLALDEGLTHATVEAIALTAGVSKRTFFNYFPTKEDAVLGTQEPTLPEGAVQEFRNGEGDIFGRTVRLMRAVVYSMIHPGTSFERRRELLRRHPELRMRLRQHVVAAEELVEPVLAERLTAKSTEEAEPAEGTGTAENIRNIESTGTAEITGTAETTGGRVTASSTQKDSARALLMLASAVMRFAYDQDPDMSPGQDAAVDAAVETFRDVMRKAI